MFLRLVLKAVCRRRWQSATTLVAVFLSSAAATAFAGIWITAGPGAGQELRTYGPNLLVQADPDSLSDGRGGAGYLPASVLDRLASPELRGEILAYTPFLSGEAEAGSRRTTVVGVWFGSLRQMYPWWQLKGQWPEEGEPLAALVGVEAAQRLRVGPGEDLRLSYEGHSWRVRVVGTIDSGEAEDGWVFVSLGAAQELFAVSGLAQRVYVSALPRGRTLEGLAADLQAQLAGSSVRAVGRIAGAEEAVSGKLQLLMAGVALSVILAGLLALVNNASASAHLRGKEIGLMKAIGASDWHVTALFMGEGIVLGLLGTLPGFGAGLAMAEMIGRTVFGSSSSPSPALALATASLALALALTGSACALRRASAVEPARSLRGE